MPHKCFVSAIDSQSGTEFIFSHVFLKNQFQNNSGFVITCDENVHNCSKCPPIQLWSRDAWSNTLEELWHPSNFESENNKKTKINCLIKKIKYWNASVSWPRANSDIFKLSREITRSDAWSNTLEELWHPSKFESGNSKKKKLNARFKSTFYLNLLFSVLRQDPGKYLSIGIFQLENGSFCLILVKLCINPTHSLSPRL